MKLTKAVGNKKILLISTISAAIVLLAAIIGIMYVQGWFPKKMSEEEALALRHAQERIQYPLAYRELIEQAASDFDLDPAHIAAVVMCESSFRPNASSSVGALGLMQIMPDTGGWIAGKFDDLTDYDTERLTEPELNLRFGCWYLAWLMARYDGDMTCATAAYHAGQGNVDKWLADSQYSDDGTTLTDIPIADTKIYTRRVLDTYEKYLELYTF